MKIFIFRIVNFDYWMKFNIIILKINILGLYIGLDYRWVMVKEVGLFINFYGLFGLWVNRN